MTKTTTPAAAQPYRCGQCKHADSWGIPLSKTCVYDCKFEPLNAAPPAAQAEPQEPLPFTFGQRRRLWDNSPGIHADAKSFAAFERIVQLVEAAHGIGKQEG